MVGQTERARTIHLSWRIIREFDWMLYRTLDILLQFFIDLLAVIQNAGRRASADES